MRSPRVGLNEDEVWQRWRGGASASEIGRAVGRTSQRVFQILVARGGVAPRPRQRSARVLSLAEREEISRGLAAGTSVRQIGRQLGRAASTVSREVRRHGGRRQYRAQTADRRAWRAAQRPKPCRLAEHPRLRQVVATKLAAQWAPEQIAGWLKVTYPDEPAMQVSHETIYRSLFVQSRGVLKAGLIRQLRRRRTMRRAQQARRPNEGAAIPDAVSIRERPPEVADRAVPGHWEGDLLAGTRQSQIATLVERQSRYVLLIRVPNKETTTVVRALTRHVRTLPTSLRASLTWDRGRELAAHRRFTVATNVQVYFCDPYSPWQRGSNENTNGLLRQYFPKGRDLSTVSQAQLNRVARLLNQRPRKTLGFRTPADMLASIVASTG
ncbi:MAG TPA: IS30 family transposase [Vicinamibacterales bacterium]|nr:IS30 family transposase [Vicinamibacterales bacterium]